MKPSRIIAFLTEVASVLNRTGGGGGAAKLLKQNVEATQKRNKECTQKYLARLNNKNNASWRVIFF